MAVGVFFFLEPLFVVAGVLFVFFVLAVIAGSFWIEQQYAVQGEEGREWEYEAEGFARGFQHHKLQIYYRGRRVCGIRRIIGKSYIGGV